MSSAYELAERLARDRDVVEKGIAEHCPVPVFVSDAQGRWVRANLPMQTMLACDERTLRNDGWLGLVDPTDMREVLEQWRDIFQKKTKQFKLRIRFTPSDGRIVSTYTSVIRLDTGNYLGFTVPICDHPFGCPIHGFLLHNIDGDNLPPKSGPEVPTQAQRK